MRESLRRVRAIATKEVLNLLREPRTLIVILLQPVVQLILYGYCITFDLHNVPFAVWDQDWSEQSRRLVDELNGGGRDRTLFLKGYVLDPRGIEPLLASEGDAISGRSKVRFVLVIPRGFERSMLAGETATVQALFDAADSNTAGITGGYLSAAVAAHNARLMTETVARRRGADFASSPLLGGEPAGSGPIDLRWRVFYNPDLSSRLFIVPGLVCVLLSILAAMLTSTTIVRERELGSLESLLTLPISASELVAGKMVPYLAAAMIDAVLVLLLGELFFGVWPRGSLLLLGSFTCLLLPAVLAIGMAVSAAAPSQQLALVIAMLVSFLPTMFLTGFAFPRSNSPTVVQIISYPLPATQYLIAVRGIFLKGAGWGVLWPQAAWLAGGAVVLIGLAVAATRRNLARGLG